MLNNRAEIARHCGLSRARFTQVMKLLTLPEEIQDHVVGLPTEAQRSYSGRRLQAVVDLGNEQVQLRVIEELRNQVS